jgi:hypothetical protein
VIHRMHVAASMTIMENLFALSPQTNKTFTMPNKTKHREKKVLIARIATTNSVALASMYEYQFHALGTKKCHIPKPIETVLPTVTKTLASRFKAIPPRMSQARPTVWLSGSGGTGETLLILAPFLARRCWPSGVAAVRLEPVLGRAATNSSL